jgi:hypothetical protein
MTQRKSLGHAFELAANENVVPLLAASASHLSPPGGDLSRLMVLTFILNTFLRG